MSTLPVFYCTYLSKFSKHSFYLLLEMKWLQKNILLQFFFFYRILKRLPMSKNNSHFFLLPLILHSCFLLAIKITQFHVDIPYFRRSKKKTQITSGIFMHFASKNVDYYLSHILRVILFQFALSREFLPRYIAFVGSIQPKHTEVVLELK